MNPVWHRHVWTNRLQSGALILFMIGLLLTVGHLLLGEDGFWIALAGVFIAVLLEPVAASGLMLRLYCARPIAVADAPQLWMMVRVLAERAGLPALPTLHYVPSRVLNAFAVGNARNCSIALSDGLLRSLSQREMAGVIAHEIAHIAHGDLRMMGLADYLSRLTGLLAVAGMISLLAMMPLLVLTDFTVNWPALLLLVSSPQLALLMQLGLSRVREFDADMKAVALTGDPEGLASALGRIAPPERDWRSVLVPGFGNPGSSWLRTHPAMRERIERLLSLRTARRWPEVASRHRDRLPASPALARRRVGDSWF